ncbi:CARF domain-containing protein [Brachyspira intermedia]|uniref:CARF domain-containing protein n=1 Tax=Brachyspira intermedia TaxID=84377 RepID=UPI0030043945
MSDKKYLLFSAIGFNDPVGSELPKDNIKEKINNYCKDSEISKEYKDNINKKDYIYSEGSMLSIVRKFQPERVMLFFTKDMYDRKDNNGTSIIDILKDEILKRSKKCSYENILIKTSNMIANSFDDDLVTDNMENFTEMIEKLKEGYEDYEILINITSGTNQIKTKLALECIYNKENNIKAVYITHPNITKTINNNEEYEDDDDDYDYTEMIDPNYKKKYKEDEDKLNYLQYLYEEYEQLESEFNTEKYYPPDFKVFLGLKIKNQISALLEKSYEYKACYDLFQDDHFINKEILTLLKYAYLRSTLQYKSDDFVNNNIDPNDNCLKEFLNNEDILIEYFYIMKLKQQKGDLSDFVLRLEPFLKYIDKNFHSYKNCNIYVELREIKNKLRHTVAHQMVNVSEDNIKEESGISSEDIINKCGELLELIYEGNFDKEYFVYDEINKKILEKF